MCRRAIRIVLWFSDGEPYAEPDFKSDSEPDFGPDVDSDSGARYINNNCSTDESALFHCFVLSCSARSVLP